MWPWEKAGTSYRYDCDYAEHASLFAKVLCVREPGWSCIEM